MTNRHLAAGRRRSPPTPALAETFARLHSASGQQGLASWHGLIRTRLRVQARRNPRSLRKREGKGATKPVEEREPFGGGGGGVSLQILADVLPPVPAAWAWRLETDEKPERAEESTWASSFSPTTTQNPSPHPSPGSGFSLRDERAGWLDRTKVTETSLAVSFLSAHKGSVKGIRRTSGCGTEWLYLAGQSLCNLSVCVSRRKCTYGSTVPGRS